VATQLVTERSAVNAGERRMSLAYAAVLLFIVVYCVRPNDWIPGAAEFPFAKIVGFFALAAFFLSVGRLGRLPKEVVYLLLLFGQLCLTVPFSPVWRRAALMHVLDFSKVVLITLVMSLTVTSLPRLRRTIFVQTACVALIAALAVLRGTFLYGRLEGVGKGDFQNSNDLALAVAMNFPFAFAFLLRARNPLAKAVWALVLMVMATAPLLTASRSGFLAILVAVGVSLWEFALRGRRHYLLVAAGIMGLGMLVLGSTRLKERFNAIANPGEDSTAHGSFEERKLLLWRSVEVTMEHPLFGVGPGMFPTISGRWKVAHNSYTQLSSEGGLPALILYLMILWRAFANVRSKKWSAREKTEPLLFAGALRASLAAYAVGSLFASVVYSFFPYFLVAYTTALAQIASAEQPSPSQASRLEHPAESNQEECYGKPAAPQASWPSY
jgi:O-antigen ligase